MQIGKALPHRSWLSSRGVALVVALLLPVGLAGGPSAQAQTSDLIFANGTIGSAEKNDICLNESIKLPHSVYACNPVGALANQAVGTARQSRDVAYKEEGGDLNGDDIPDLVFANIRRRAFEDTQPAKARVCLNQNRINYGKKEVNYLSSCYLIDSRQAVGVVISDIDGDGDNDLAFANRNRPSRVCRNDGTGNFSCKDVGSGIREATDVAAGELNGDSYPDLVYSASSPNSGQLNQVCLNDGSGNFTCSGISPPEGAANRSLGVATGLVGSDSDTDVIFANTGSGGRQNAACANDGTGNFTCLLISGGSVSGASAETAGVDYEVNRSKGTEGLAVFANLSSANGGRLNKVCTNDRDGGSDNTTEGIDFTCEDIPLTSATDDARNDTRGVDIGDLDINRSVDALDAAFANPGANRVCRSVRNTNNPGQTGGIRCTTAISGSTEPPKKSSFGVVLGNTDGDGFIRVVKEAEASDARSPVKFPFQVTDPRDLTAPSGPDKTRFSLDDDQSRNPSVPASVTLRRLGRDTTYAVAETRAPNRWILHSLSCDVQGSSPFPTFKGEESLLHARARVGLKFGQQVTCHFTNKNTKEASGNGKVIVTKTANPNGNANTQFPFAGDLGSFVINPSIGVNHTESGLIPGRYVIGEGGTTNYALREASCVGAKSASGFTFPQDGYRDTGGVIFLVKNNNTTRCEFVNDEMGKIKVKKVTVTNGAKINTPAQFNIKGQTIINATKESKKLREVTLDTDPSTSNPSKFSYNKVLPSSTFPPPSTRLLKNTYDIREQIRFDQFVVSNIKVSNSPKVYRKEILNNGDELIKSIKNLRTKAILELPPGGSVGVSFVNEKAGGVIVNKNTKPDHSRDFTYELKRGSNKLGSFVLDDRGGDGTASQRKGDLLAGTYTITESKEPNWTTSAINCTVRSGSSSSVTKVLPKQKVTVDLKKGEVVECTFVNKKRTRDYGDAPDKVTQQLYPTYKNHNGASHKKGAYHLGRSVDVDRGGQPTATADGDDTNGTDDEDGVTFKSQLAAGQRAAVAVKASISGVLAAWMDFNGDNTWQSGETIIPNVRLQAGKNRIPFKIPPKTKAKTTFARFRFNETGGLTPTGAARVGEVEDYKVKIAKGETSPSSVTGNPSSEGAELEWTASESENVAAYYIYRDTAPIDSSTSPSALSPYDSTGAETTSYVDAEAKFGQTYYYRVTTVNEEGIESPRLSEQAQVFLYPENYLVEVSRSFGDASGPEDYRLVALPGQVKRPLTETTSGKQGLDWQAFWDDGSSENFLLRFDGSEVFTFRPGEGFWLTHKEEWAVDQSVPAVKLRGDSAVTIDLHEGWNIISNPTDKAVAWSHVTAENGGDLQPLWAFDGSFAQTDSFRSARSGVAYYFHNSTGLDLLSVPYPGSPPETVEDSKSKQKARPQILTLTARPSSGEVKSGETVSSIHVGTAQAANKGKDPLDVLAPPSRFSAVALRLKASKVAREAGLPARQRRWARDIRPNGAKGNLYSLLLRGKPGTTVRLMPDGLHAFSGQRAALLDPSRGTSYDLHPGGTVELTLQDSTRTLTLALGDEEYVRSQKQAVRPDEVSLRSYPNPFRQRSNLVYTLPEKAEVRLAIYDVLGRQLAVLADGRRPAGRHRVQLRTSQLSELSSGVYFVRLRAAGQTLTHKITVVR